MCQENVRKRAPLLSPLSPYLLPKWDISFQDKKKKSAEVLGRRAPMLSHDSALNETTVLALRRSRRSLIGVKAKKHTHPSVEARRRCAPSDTVTGFG